MTPALMAAALLAPVPAAQFGGLFDNLFGEAEPAQTARAVESGSHVAPRRRIEAGSALLEAGSGCGARCGCGSSRTSAATSIETGRSPVRCGGGCRYNSRRSKPAAGVGCVPR